MKLKRIVLFAAIITIIISLTACKSTDYENALELYYEATDYEAALEMFEELGDYKNSSDMADRARYDLAYYTYFLSASESYDEARQSHFRSTDVEGILEKYNKAIAIFEEIGSPICLSEAKMVAKEKTQFEIDKGVYEVVSMFSDDPAAATSALNTYLEITEYNGVQYPYAERFTQVAKDLLEENESLAYSVITKVVDWAEKTGNTEYDADALYRTFKDLRWRACDVGDVILLGKCIQDTSGSLKPIKWVVIAKENGRMLLLSQKGLRRGSATESFKQEFLSESKFTDDEMKAIGSLSNITDLSIYDYEKYNDIIHANPCTATYWAFCETRRSTPWQKNVRYQWQIDELDTTPVYWFLQDNKIANYLTRGYIPSHTETYCRPAIWLKIV